MDGIVVREDRRSRISLRDLWDGFDIKDGMKVPSGCGQRVEIKYEREDGSVGVA